MTEDEAKTKTCCGPPSVANVMAVVSGLMRTTGAPSLCEGSACMAWRWEVSPAAASAYDRIIGGAPIVAGGYCGLAGRPA